MEARIGEVFTPLAWGLWAVREFGLLEKWLAGASVFDPTMGDGVLLEALVAAALERGRAAGSLPLKNLYGLELKAPLRDAFLERMRSRYGVSLPEGNFRVGDFLLSGGSPVADVLFGNPPWVTYAALPETYKRAVRRLFLEYGLVRSGRSVLLGNSRVDLAALVVRKAVAENLEARGEAVFFLPLSLLFNDGANEAFRSPWPGGPEVRIDAVYDLAGTEAFPGVSTRCGVVRFRRDEAPVFPADYYRFEGERWRPFAAGPRFGTGSPWSVDAEAGAEGAAAAGPEGPRGTEASGREVRGREVRGVRSGWNREPIPVPRESAPRQGVNTSGANDLFFFDAAEPAGGGLLRVSNAAGNEAVLPAGFLRPCLQAVNFAEDEPRPKRWVFLPYGEDGKPLSPEEVERNASLAAYLGRHRERLSARKGVLVGSWIRRGYYWALLGVGPYCFFPWKIVWEAYGRKRFLPRIFEGRWQANQALQCYLPFKDREACDRAFTALADGGAERYLLSTTMAGTMNWAQPGRIKRLLRLV